MVVVQYSPACRQALELATRLASGLRGELIVLGLIPIGVHGTGSRVGGIERRKPVELVRLESFAAGTLGAHPLVPYELAIAFALSSHRHVTEIATVRRVDLIVVGDARGPLRRRLLGGLADRLRATAPCPVLIVNRNARSSLLATAGRLASPDAFRRQPARLAGSGSDPAGSRDERSGSTAAYDAPRAP
jgi:nucleotide-binding universal stress UspA family protein